MCVLKVYSDTDSFEVFSKKTDIPVITCGNKGDYITKNRSLDKYVIHFDVSKKDFDDFNGQLNDAILFLNKYMKQLKDFFAIYSITDAYMDFAL